MGSPPIFDIDLATSPPAAAAESDKASAADAAERGPLKLAGVSLSLATKAGVMARDARAKRTTQQREVARQERLRSEPTRRQVGFHVNEGDAAAHPPG